MFDAELFLLTVVKWTMFTLLITALTAASFRGLQTFAGPLGQKSIFDWPGSGPATDPVQLEVVLNLLVATATTY